MLLPTPLPNFRSKSCSFFLLLESLQQYKKIKPNIRSDSCHLGLIKNDKLINLIRNEAATSLEESSFHLLSCNRLPWPGPVHWDSDTPTLCQPTISGRNTWTRPCGPHGSIRYFGRGSSVLLSPAAGLCQPELCCRSPGWAWTDITLEDWQLLSSEKLVPQTNCWKQAQHSLRLERPKALG